MRRELSLVGASLVAYACALVLGSLIICEGLCERGRGRMGDTRQCCPCPHRTMLDRAGLTLRARHVALGTDRCGRRADA